MFAAGNNGGQGASTLSIQASAKNVIAVGAGESVQNIGNVAFFSSLGPTYDSRLGFCCFLVTGVKLQSIFM